MYCTVEIQNPGARLDHLTYKIIIILFIEWSRKAQSSDFPLRSVRNLNYFGFQTFTVQATILEEPLTKVNV